jgi:hypothetical protein
MITKVDTAGLKPGPDQQRPEIAFVVIHLVVVHLDLRAQAKMEGGKFQKTLSEPRRNVNKKHPGVLQ